MLGSATRSICRQFKQLRLWRPAITDGRPGWVRTERHDAARCAARLRRRAKRKASGHVARHSSFDAQQQCLPVPRGDRPPAFCQNSRRCASTASGHVAQGPVDCAGSTELAVEQVGVGFASVRSSINLLVCINEGAQVTTVAGP